MVQGLLLLLAAPATATVAPPVAPPKPITRAEAVARADRAFAGVDTNHDGSLSLAELQAAQLHAVQQRIIAQFRQLDTNHDGQLSLQEFAAGFGTARVNEVAAKILQQLDTNHDGKLSAEEFRAPQMADFAKVDANHDGVVTPAEIQAYGKAHQPPQQR